MLISYVTGDATYPKGESTKIIIHVCNDVGAWGKGFVLALSKRWKNPEKEYREWYRTGKTINLIPFKLGCVQIVKVETDILVANMIAQKGIRRNVQTKLIDYNALTTCLQKVIEFADGLYSNVSIHMPRIGAGLGGGNWNTIENIINNIFESSPHEVYVYNLPFKK